MTDDSPDQGAGAIRLGGRAEYRQWPFLNRAPDEIGVIWQFTGDRTHSEAAEQRAQRGIAVSFWLLAPYVAAESVHGLLTGHRPDPSGLGPCRPERGVMPLLGHAKHRPGARLGSAATAGEGTQSLLCAALVAAVLISLAVNAALGWWWLDSCAGLTVASAAIREGRDAWHGKGCC